MADDMMGDGNCGCTIAKGNNGDSTMDGRTVVQS